MKTKIFLLNLIFLLLPSLIYSQTIPTPWNWPITSDYGPRIIDGAYDFHEGIDYSAAPGDADLGTPIPAVEGGRIETIGPLGGSGCFYNIEVIGDNTCDRWFYGHIFRNNDLTIGNWELRLNTVLIRPTDGDVRQGNIIILWSGPITRVMQE